MRKAKEVLDDILLRYKAKQVLSSDEKICIAMKEYAKEVLQEFIASETDNEGGTLRVWFNCGISTDQDKLDKFKNSLQ